MDRLGRVAVRVALAAALIATAGGIAAISSVASAAATPKPTPAIATGAQPRVAAGRLTAPTSAPASGSGAFLLTLDTASTATAFRTSAARGTASATTAARAQAARVVAAQNRVIAALPTGSHVLYRTQSVLAGVAVLTGVANEPTLDRIAGVSAVYPITPKTISNATAVPLEQGPPVWQAYGDLGADSSIAIIDTGIDYTHADFGGTGTTAAYTAAHAHGTAAATGFPNAKIVGGYDFAGDAYNPSPGSATPSHPYSPTPKPDPNPLDCNGHGTHVAATAAGLGVTASGATYAGAYDTSTPFATMRIGPGVAPAAKIYAYRVFGCTGGTELIGEAIDRADDPDQNGVPTDHVDVINLSLGSSFASPQDGDAVMANAAAAAGITVVAAAGNSGDEYDAAGSPGDAPRVIAVAGSTDGAAQVDALHVAAPDSVLGDYAASRSQTYDWTHGDLAGDVYALTDPANADGCDDYSTDDAAGSLGKIVFLEWTADDATRRCGSPQRVDKAVAAGAVGVVFAADTESLSIGVVGTAALPSVLLVKSASDALRTSLLAGDTVTINGTTAAGYLQHLPELDDQVFSDSSRGIRTAGDTKPDVSAVSTAVISAANGSGNGSTTMTGTSMASPQVAGEAALVLSHHQDWTPEQVKADIMNTADQDMYAGPGHTGAIYAPNRVGAGRIDIKAAIDNSVLAYVTNDPGAVTASFGPVAVTAATTLTKTIKVQNTTSNPHTFAVSYNAITSVPGASYSVTPASLSLAGGQSANVTLHLALDPTKLTKTVDPTVPLVQDARARQYVADASGRVLLTTAGEPTLRVPVYSSPRPASVMTQPSSVSIPAGTVQSTLLSLTGKRVNQGIGLTTIRSAVAGFELAAKSGLAPTCSTKITTLCLSFADERSADLKYLGVTSDVPQRAAIGQPASSGLLYFAISTQGAWRTPVDDQRFDVKIDVNGDGVPDVTLFNMRRSASNDVMVAEALNAHTGAVLDQEPINDSYGDTDTAMFDSDTLVLPVAISALHLGRTSRIRYGVLSYSSDQTTPVDSIGLSPAGNPNGTLTVDPLRPGLAIYGSYDGDTSTLLYRDSPGSVLKIRRDRDAYSADHGAGALIVHFHNAVGTKAQPVTLISAKTASTVALAIAPRSVQRRTSATVTVSVANPVGMVPTGAVTVTRITGPSAPSAVRVRSLTNGRATFTYAPKVRKGTYLFRATYAGDSYYLPGTSAQFSLKVT